MLNDRSARVAELERCLASLGSPVPGTSTQPTGGSFRVESIRN